MRKVPLVTNEIYHVFNRGVNRGNIFFADNDYKRLLEAVFHYRTNSTKFSYQKPFNDPVSLGSFEDSSREKGVAKVQIIAYCLMPNHFHFLVKQLVDGGITSFVRHLFNSYAHYVNVKYGRIGPLLQGRFKNVHIESQEQLVHVSRYIHLNPLVAGLIPDLRNYRWSSYPIYCGVKDKDGIVDPEIVTNEFKSSNDYEKFVLDQADYGIALERIKHLLLE